MWFEDWVSGNWFQDLVSGFGLRIRVQDLSEVKVNEIGFKILFKDLVRAFGFDLVSENWFRDLV